jgi:Protein of unknown function (DUF1353)
MSEAPSAVVVIEAELQFPIAVNHLMNGHPPFVTLCPIVFRLGEHRLPVPRGFQFDGASVPRWLWWLKGFSPLDRSIVAALAHDWLCEHPEILPRVVGDAIFISLLRRSGISEWRATLMYLAVRAWSVCRRSAP